MAWKHLKQRSLADDLLFHHACLEELDGVNKLIDWVGIELLLSGIHSNTKGAPAWPPLMMFKALLLQAWYDLGDERLEKQLARDLLFRRFVGISLDQEVPDHSSLWRFRNKLESENLFDEALSLINTQLREQGLMIKTGEVSIIDASVIEARNARPRKNAEGKNTQDPEAAYNVKQGSDGKRKTTYGYKVHANVDEDGFIKKATFTPGHVHDSKAFEALLTGNEKEAYADSAYKSKAHSARLKKAGVRERLTHRAYRNNPLTDEQKRENRLNSTTRSIVEGVFGILKMHYGMKKARYMGLARNKARIGMLSIAYNLKRAARIQDECLA